MIAICDAWNELVEGAELGTDRRFGYAHLQTTADILRAFVGLRARGDPG